MGREGHEVTAVDYTEAMLAEAERNCENYQVTAHFSKMDAHNLEFADNSFDLILSRNLIWDLKERRPQWDVNTLIEMGVQSIQVDTDGRDSYQIEQQGELLYLPFSFLICATK